MITAEQWTVATRFDAGSCSCYLNAVAMAPKVLPSKLCVLFSRNTTFVCQFLFQPTYSATPSCLKFAEPLSASVDYVCRCDTCRVAEKFDKYPRIISDEATLAFLVHYDDQLQRTR